MVEEKYVVLEKYKYKIEYLVSHFSPVRKSKKEIKADFLKDHPELKRSWVKIENVIDYNTEPDDTWYEYDVIVFKYEEFSKEQMEDDGYGELTVIEKFIPRFDGIPHDDYYPMCKPNVIWISQ